MTRSHYIFLSLLILILSLPLSFFFSDPSVPLQSKITHLAFKILRLCSGIGASYFSRGILDTMWGFQDLWFEVPKGVDIIRMEAPSLIDDYKVPVKMLWNRQWKDEKLKKIPLVFYIHGGGWVMEAPPVDHGEKFVEKEFIFAAVKYRLAPEFKFPIPLEDCYSALSYFLDLFEAYNSTGISKDVDKSNISHEKKNQKNKNEFSKKERINDDLNKQWLKFWDGRIILMGDSAGGNLAAGLTFLQRDRNLGANIITQILIYPGMNTHDRLASHVQFGDWYVLDEEIVKWFSNQYEREDDDWDNPYFAPLQQTNLNNLPKKTYFVLAFRDYLYSEGKEYYEKVKGATETVLKEYPAEHAFLFYGGEEEERALEDLFYYLKKEVK